MKFIGKGGVKKNIKLFYLHKRDKNTELDIIYYYCRHTVYILTIGEWPLWLIFPHYFSANLNFSLTNWKTFSIPSKSFSINKIIIFKKPNKVSSICILCINFELKKQYPNFPNFPSLTFPNLLSSNKRKLLLFFLYSSSTVYCRSKIFIFS